MATVRDKVREVIADETIGKDKVGEITPETHVQNDLGADSLTVVEIVMKIEELCDLEIPDEEQKALETVGAIEEYLAEKGIQLDAAA